MEFNAELIKEKNPEMFELPSEEEIKNLRGIEFIFMYHDEDDNSIVEVPAYVAQADRNKGITIRGKLPFEDKYNLYENSDDVILACCSKNSAEIDDPYYLYNLNKYKIMVLSGKFDDHFDDFSRASNILDGVCAFN